MKLDLLAIGVHPDDVELGCSGTIINEIKRGKKAGIVDLTQGELGTRGNIDTRYQEAANAAMIMGVQVRENLKMRDGFFENDETNKLKLITAIRKYQPEIVIGNVLHDRHPDHGRAGQLIADACFLAGLTKIMTKDENGNEQQRWRPSYVLHYIQDWYHEPDLLIDIIIQYLLPVDLPAAYKTDTKVQTLLAGQVTNSYWTTAWNNYVANPTTANTNTVKTRLNSLLTTLLQLAEYQLM